MRRLARLRKGTSSVSGPLLALVTGVAFALVLLGYVSYETEASFDPCSPHSYGPPYISPAIPICWSLTQLPQYQDGSDWAYPFQVASVYTGFPLFINNLSFDVRSNAGLTAPFQAVTILSQAGHLLAEYNYTRAQWDLGSADKVTVGMEVTLQAVTSLAGDIVLMNGESPNGDSEDWGFTLT